MAAQPSGPVMLKEGKKCVHVPSPAHDTKSLVREHFPKPNLHLNMSWVRTILYLLYIGQIDGFAHLGRMYENLDQLLDT